MDLSLVCPCYNEASHLRRSVAELLEVLEQTRYEFEVIFVDDGSGDGTREIVQDLCAGEPRFRCVFHERNRGRGGAFKTGFAAATGRITGFIDVDLEVLPLYVPPLVNLVDRHGYDVVTGHRYYLLSQTGGLFRDVLSRGYRLLCRVLLGAGIRDSETGCKFFRRETASDVVLGSECDGWFWDTEVMFRAALAGLRIHEMPVLFLRRDDKESTVRVLRDSWQHLVRLWEFRARVGLTLLDRSPVFWSTVGYDLTMQAIHGGRRRLRQAMAEVAELIEPGSSVTDVCCGSASLYRDFLRERGCRYLGLDYNGRFILSARNRGIPARLFDLRREDPPVSDYVVMTMSCFHFHDQEREVLAKLKRAARRAVIVAESVRNLAELPIVGPLANWLARPGAGECRYRYDPESFRRFAEAGAASRFIHRPGDRTAIAVFDTAPGRP